MPDHPSSRSLGAWQIAAQSMAVALLGYLVAGAAEIGLILETVPDADLIHVDFGISGTGKFVPVGPGEAVKVTLILNDEQANLLARVKQMKTAVKFRSGTEPMGEVQSVLLPAVVHVTLP